MNNVEHAHKLARFFSRTVLQDIARRGCADSVGRELLSLGLAPGEDQISVADLFEASFSVLSRQYRCEYVYKSAIANRIIFGRHSARTASLAIELAAANSIADAVVFNGTSTAYEIKTEFDTHRRLSTQTADYLRAFERVYVVTHPALAARYASLVDERVGVLSLNGRNQLSQFRPAIPDLNRIEPAVVCRMLRLNELMTVVERYFGPQPELPNTRIRQHYEALFCTLDSAAVHSALVSSFRARTTSNDVARYVSDMPACLRALAYATPLSRPQRKRLLEALFRPLNYSRLAVPCF